MVKRNYWFALIAAAFLFAACGDDLQDLQDALEDAENFNTELSVDAEACLHMEDGPFNDVTADNHADDHAPFVASDHHGHRITLPANESGEGDPYRGHVQFESDEETDYVLFLDADVHLHVLDANGAELEHAIEGHKDHSDDCAPVQARYVVELGIGTYFFEFEADEAGPFTLVIEEEGHGHEQDDGHDDDDHARD